MIDIWRKYIELNLQNLGKENEIKYGQSFLKSDRDCTKSVVEKMISIHLVPHLASKIT